MARINKSLAKKLTKEVGHGYVHRDHRSKKGRNYKPNYEHIKAYKLKVEELKAKELEEELYEAKQKSNSDIDL